MICVKSFSIADLDATELSWNRKYDIAKFEHIVVTAHCPGKLLVTLDGPNIICDFCRRAFTESRFRRHKCPSHLQEGDITDQPAGAALFPEVDNDERKKRLWGIKSGALPTTTVRSMVFSISHSENRFVLS